MPTFLASTVRMATKRIAFKLPEPLPQRKNKDGTDRKPLSPNTIKLYKAMLNVLARAGWLTVDALIEKARDVVKHIKEIHVEDKQKQRLMLSAVFFVMPQSYLASTNPYHQAFGEARDRPEFVEDE